jgi:hypothetical protein
MKPPRRAATSVCARRLPAPGFRNAGCKTFPLKAGALGSQRQVVNLAAAITGTAPARTRKKASKSLVMLI